MYKILLCAFLFFSARIQANIPLDDMWEKTHYIWDFGLITACDSGPIPNAREYFSKEDNKIHFNPNRFESIKEGDLIWLRCLEVSFFYQQILPKLQCSVVLVIANGDESFPSQCGVCIETLLEDERILHIFAQNNDYQGSSKKISHIPIGMDFHTIAYKGRQGGWGEKGSPLQQESQLNFILKKLKPTHLRKKRVFVDFHHADTMHGGYKRYLEHNEDRASIFKYLLSTGLIDHGKWMKRSSLWKTKGRYAFSISPHGNGLDCHRTWEDLVLGCIVIVKTSVLDPLYEELPVVIVKDWSEITEENLDKWLKQYGDVSSNLVYREKLTNDYWIFKMKGVAKTYLRGMQ